MKAITSSRHLPLNTSTKEMLQLNQLLSEVLRSVMARSDDIWTLRSLSDAKTGKARMSSLIAEKVLAEIEVKEDWRLTREDTLISALAGTRLQNPIQRKCDIDRHIDTICRKMFKVNLQFADEPTASELNSSEQHVLAIMGTKVCDSNTFSDEGRLEVSLPCTAPDRKDWREDLSKDAKILDACLQSEEVNVATVLMLGLRTSRVAFDRELAKQRGVLDDFATSATRSPGLFPSCRSLRSRNLLQPVKRASSLRSRQSTIMLEWRSHMLSALMIKNQDICQSVKDFIAEVRERKEKGQKVKPRPDNEDEYVAKCQRARNYEKHGAASPAAASLSRLKSTVRAQSRLLRDAIGPFFPANMPLERRVKVVHSIRLIQRAFRQLKNRRKVRAVLTIQTWLRGKSAVLWLLYTKFARFRQVYFAAKLRHWYPLMVNRHREKRSKCRRKFNFAGCQRQITIIQKHIRRYLVQKQTLRWAKVFYAHRLQRLAKVRELLKQATWKMCRTLEEDLLKTARAVEDQITDSTIAVKQGKKLRGFESEREMLEYMENLEKAELSCRRQKLWMCTSLRQRQIV